MSNPRFTPSNTAYQYTAGELEEMNAAFDLLWEEKVKHNPSLPLDDLIAKSARDAIAEEILTGFVGKIPRGDDN